MDEIPVQQIEPINYRQKFGVSFRDGGFFFGTVRDNMNFHRPNASDNELVEGARMSGALPWIHMQPSGFDTRVGEAGAGLSSGQRQTLALSRAFVGKSEILLLDEPTSDLDNRTENEFVNRLRQLPEDKTMIVVTHRPAVIDACHRLIVIDKGGILLDGEKSLVLARLKQINAAERAEGAA